MPRSRGFVILAWFFFAVVCSTSLYNAGRLLVQPGFSIDRFGEALFTLLPLFLALPAALIITRQPRNKIGWLLLIYPLVSIPTELFSLTLSRYQPGPPPATFLNLFMAWAVDLSWMAMIFPVLLVPLFFPTGRLISPRWRWVVYLTIGMTLFLMIFSALIRYVQPEFATWTVINPIGFIPNEAVEVFLAPWSLLLAVLTVASLASVFVRFRRGSLVERQQIKWLLYACFVFGLTYIPGVFNNANTSQWETSKLGAILLPITMMTIPAAITIAIFRYRLFDIDVIIRRTLQYSLITLLLGLVYLGSVILLQTAFREVFRQGEDFAIVLSTLGIAALFAPLRRRAQSFIDRRFFRSKYNADAILAGFHDTTRSVVTMELLTTQLLQAVSESVQPEQASLWLRPIHKKDPGI